MEPKPKGKPSEAGPADKVATPSTAKSSTRTDWSIPTNYPDGTGFVITGIIPPPKAKPKDHDK